MCNPALAAILLGACGLLAGCSRELDRRTVAEFIDKADDAARKRFAPEICELRGENFRLRMIFHAHASNRPEEMEITRKLFCQQAGSFSQLRQYKLERTSMDIDIATDRKTATVIAEYVETMPYYEPHAMPATPDDFREFQVVETVDQSVVGIEGGDPVFLSTTSESFQTLVAKEAITLPYD
jgi:hypothetical protein